MNKQQKQVLQSQLNSEQQTLKKLKGIYKKALDDVNDKIAVLQGRTDVENLQSIIYQTQYQEALKQQISGILDTLNGEQFGTVSEYLTKSYEDGFIGTMYDLHGQGIPLVFPIDQNQVAKALTIDSKLSKPLYNKLGEDVDLLKKRIQNNISRGIAQGQSYNQIAKNIASGMVGDYGTMRGGALGKAMTITRTESHRINQQAAYDAMKKAKDNGADIVKQWDSTIDKRTRPHHAQLDGQIKEIEEPFEVAGRHALYPCGFGVAAEDIQCRCTMLQRAKWALDEEELETLKKRAEFFGLDKNDSFEEFKKKYIKADIPPVITKPFEGKKYSMNPDGTLVEGENQYLDSFDLSDITSDKVITEEQYLKLSPDEFDKYDFIIKNDGTIQFIGSSDNLTKLQSSLGSKWDELTYTLNEDGTFSIGTKKLQAQYKINLQNNKVLNVDVTKAVDDNIAVLGKDFDFDDTIKFRVKYESLPKEIQDEIQNVYNAYGGAASLEDVTYQVLKNKGYNGIHVINMNSATQDKIFEFIQVFDDGLVTKTKKSKLETLTSSLATQQKKLSKIDNKTYSGIWKDDVKVSDYSVKKGSIQGKRDYYTQQIDKAKKYFDSGIYTEAEYKKIVGDYQKYLDDLDEFEKLGSEYEKIELKIKKTKSDIKKYTPKTGVSSTADAFTQERKDAAYWFTDANGSTKGADAVLRDKCGEVWRNAPLKEKEAIYGYTRSYSKINEPLRGIEYGTNKYLGVGNVDLNMIGVNGYGGYKPGEVKAQIDAMTDIIDKSSYDFDIWVNRGVRYNGMDKFFGIDSSDFYLSESELAAKLVDTTPTEYGFMSTGVAKGKGFGGDIKLNIYCPEGTKMMYAEPFSAYGNGDGWDWDGITKQSSFGGESEMILQRGTQFRVTKVTKANGTWYIDMDVIGQSPQ